MTFETDHNPKTDTLEQQHARELEAAAATDGVDPAEPAEPAAAVAEREPRSEAAAVPDERLRRVTPHDEARAAIADRFRHRRAAAGGQLDFHGDHRDPTQIYGQVATPATASGKPEPLSAVAH